VAKLGADRQTGTHTHTHTNTTQHKHGQATNNRCKSQPHDGSQNWSMLWVLCVEVILYILNRKQQMSFKIPLMWLYIMHVLAVTYDCYCNNTC
jgi:hypothetical protein